MDTKQRKETETAEESNSNSNKKRKVSHGSSTNSSSNESSSGSRAFVDDSKVVFDERNLSTFMKKKPFKGDCFKRGYYEANSDETKEFGKKIDVLAQKIDTISLGMLGRQPEARDRQIDNQIETIKELFTNIHSLEIQLQKLEEENTTLKNENKSLKEAGNNFFSNRNSPTLYPSIENTNSEARLENTLANDITTLR